MDLFITYACLYACACTYARMYAFVYVRAYERLNIQASVQATTFADFCASIRDRRGSVKTNILIARAPRDSDEKCWLARATRDPFQTSIASTIGDDIVDKGTWVVPVEWYNLVKVDGRGVRVYARGNRNQWPLIVRSLIAVSNQNCVTFDTVSGAGSGGQYKLTREMHELILNYGNWDTGWVGDE